MKNWGWPGRLILGALVGGTLIGSALPQDETHRHRTNPAADLRHLDDQRFSRPSLLDVHEGPTAVKAAANVVL